MAKKGLEKRGEPNLLADEELVVLAVMSGILTGRETIILTRDNDLLEQFYKLIYLIDTHYVSLLVGNEYVKQPMNFPAMDMPSITETQNLFDGEDNHLIWLPAGYLKSPSLLPVVFEFVQLYCFCLARMGNQEKVSFLNFSAEREMSALFDVKGLTRGQNTQALGTRNCHVYFAPNVTGFSGKAAIANDRMAQADGLSFPTVDRDLSLKRIERTARIAHPADTSEASWPNPLGLSLATYRATARLAFSWSGKWLSLTPEAMTTAVTYSNPNTIFFLESSFLRVDVHDTVIEAWKEKHVLVPEFTHDEGANANRLIQAIVSSSKAKEKRRRSPESPSSLFSTSAWNPLTVYDYYLGLLAFRKLFFGVVESDFERTHGQRPTEAEWRQECEAYCGVGGLRLADQGRTRQCDPALFDNERLLVRAFVDAICLGTDVVILTRDPLVMDQFAKLAYLVRQHYIAVTLARQVAKRPERIAFRPLQQSLNLPRDVFESDLEVAQITDAELLAMLPEKPYHVNLHCWLFSETDKEAHRVSVMSFCAERPMVTLLQTKALTCGRNTDRFEGRNVHVVGLCGEMYWPQNTLVAIAHDRLISVGSRVFPEDQRLGLIQKEYAAVDLMHVINKGPMPDVPAVLETNGLSDDSRPGDTNASKTE